MSRFYLCLLLCLIIPHNAVRAAEVTLPVRVQIISMETWQSMQDSELQTQDANQDANYEYEALSANSFTAPQTEEVTYNLSSNTDMNALLFARLDMNSDGAITMTEYLARGGRRATEDSFHALDRNDDDLLSIAELENFYSL